MKWPQKILSTLFGIGFFPIAPGTVASFAVLCLYKFYLYRLNWILYLPALLFFFLLGVWASSSYASELRSKDPRRIVWDEAVGQLLVFFRINPSWPVLLLSFGLFRVFDIFKPFPIKKTEKFPSGWGIMLDDIVAALYAGILVNLYLILR